MYLHQRCYRALNRDVWYILNLRGTHKSLSRLLFTSEPLIAIIYFIIFSPLLAPINTDPFFPFSRYFIHEKYFVSLSMLSLISVCRESAIRITRCMRVCTTPRAIWLSLVHPPLPRKQTWHPRVYTHTPWLEDERGTSNIHTKSRQALFKRIHKAN